jgi:hypothetical protein
LSVFDKEQTKVNAEMKFADVLLDHEDTIHKRYGCGRDLTTHQPNPNTEMTEEEKGRLGGGKRKAILCGHIRN